MRAGSALASSPRPLPKDGDGWVGGRPGVSALRLHPAAMPGGVVGAVRHGEGDASGTNGSRNGSELFSSTREPEAEADFEMCNRQRGARDLGTFERMSAMADRHHIRIEYVPLGGGRPPTPPVWRRGFSRSGKTASVRSRW